MHFALILAMTMAMQGEAKKAPPRPVPPPQPVTIAPPRMVTTTVPTTMPRPPKGQESEPLPKTPPYSWVTTRDYPSAMLRVEAQGRTSAKLEVDKDGRVSGCRVTGTSGHDILDEATCRFLTLRARFYPAQDKKGAPTEGSYTTNVVWKIPDDGPGYFVNDGYPAPPSMVNYSDFVPQEEDYPEEALKSQRSGRNVVELSIDSEGSVNMCRIESSSGHADLDVASCEFATKNWIFRPARDVEGNPTEGRYRRSIVWNLPRTPLPTRVIQPPPSFQTETFPRPPQMRGYSVYSSPKQYDYPEAAWNEEREGETLVALDIDANGAMAACRITQSSGHKDLDQAACDHIRSRANFSPALDIEGKAAPGRITTGVNWQRERNVDGDLVKSVSYPAPPPRMRQPTPNYFAEPGYVDVEMTMEADGSMSKCNVTPSSNQGPLFMNIGVMKSVLCMQMESERTKFVPFKDSEGNAVAKKIKIRVKLDLEDVEGADE